MALCGKRHIDCATSCKKAMNGLTISNERLGVSSYGQTQVFNTLRAGSFKLFKRLFPGFLTILTL